MTDEQVLRAYQRHSEIEPTAQDAIRATAKELRLPEHEVRGLIWVYAAGMVG